MARPTQGILPKDLWVKIRVTDVFLQELNKARTKLEKVNKRKVSQSDTLLHVLLRYNGKD